MIDVLVVEDDQDILDVTQLLLESAGYSVETAKNGFEAMDRLRQNGRVSLILLDLMMPVADGWWFRAAVAQAPPFADIPIVIVTGAGVMADNAASLEVAERLTKPLTAQTLLSTVRRFCGPPANHSP